MPRVLLYGATGALGGATVDVYRSHGWEVFPVVRKSSGLENEIVLPLVNLKDPFDAIVFAQGANYNGGLMTVTDEQINELFEANVGFVVKQIRYLVQNELIKRKGKIVIVSSLAELFTRKEKLAYTISKAAVGGLVRSLAVDLGRSHEILVNAILPGVVDSPMVRATLGEEQLEHIIGSTPIGSLVTRVDVGNSIYLLGSELNTGISGVSVLVDNAHSVTYLP
ncbi:unannotated protein [freshwater metagenome]|uniref:Unannotated protein n=1 Tax=freshwater metagenome TaxID=449393 RepID=A0A6J7ABF3_9ZZZZ|nr:SDR family NAD(P)-dependent oxidoreductase [Actinomycetota bacterium]MSV64016.1 SDR family oxidoreductase [Actinomycetota bacterium]MSW25802.1 SDR family oxidoreductase [Actinomycetota bacterium]MSW34094.1 SDR family oxidoreductase [Actinomycetota bacterium]MSX30656.1 SDR family oxidoreductase [Actinomycetota bacterium]